MSAFCRSLAANATLTALNLESNKLFLRGGQLLADALGKNSTLAMLNVANTGIGTSGAAYLAAAASRHPAMDRLVLAFFPLPVQSLRGAPTVAELDFRGMELTSEDVVAVATMCTENRYLRALKCVAPLPNPHRPRPRTARPLRPCRTAPPHPDAAPQPLWRRCGA